MRFPLVYCLLVSVFIPLIHCTSSSERPPSTQLGISRLGVFQGVGAHSVTGNAVFRVDTEGNATLTLLDDFRSDFEPDLRLYLAQASGRPTSSSIELGSLRSTSGRQTYTVPTPIDIDNFPYLLIHSNSSNTPFGHAMLTGSSQGTIRSGVFQGVGRYSVTGSVEFRVDSAGNATLTLQDDFRSDPGSRLYLYLTQASGRPTSSSIDLGRLQSFSGRQTYAVPTPINIDDFPYVLVYCLNVEAPFGQAMLGR